MVFFLNIETNLASIVSIVSVEGHTVLGGDIADNVNVTHGKLPVGFLLAKTQSPALLPAAGMSLHTQKHRPLETHNASFQYRTKPKLQSKRYQGKEMIPS